MPSLWVIEVLFFILSFVFKFNICVSISALHLCLSVIGNRPCFVASVVLNHLFFLKLFCPRSFKNKIHSSLHDCSPPFKSTVLCSTNIRSITFLSAIGFLPSFFAFILSECWVIALNYFCCFFIKEKSLKLHLLFFIVPM